MRGRPAQAAFLLRRQPLEHCCKHVLDSKSQWQLDPVCNTPNSTARSCCDPCRLRQELAWVWGGPTPSKGSTSKRGISKGADKGLSLDPEIVLWNSAMVGTWGKGGRGFMFGGLGSLTGAGGPGPAKPELPPKAAGEVMPPSRPLKNFDLSFSPTNGLTLRPGVACGTQLSQHSRPCFEKPWSLRVVKVHFLAAFLPARHIERPAFPLSMPTQRAICLAVLFH